MSPSVTKYSQCLVTPCEATPRGTLPLSSLDRHPGLRRLCRVILLYKYGKDPAGEIKNALSKALVAYYPIAGRLQVHPERGELVVACTGEGIWYAEARADCSLVDADYLQPPCPLSDGDIFAALTHDPNAVLSIQVTQFTCGGFAVGVTFSHVMFDIVGLSIFLKAVGEIAGGSTRPTADPIWCRDEFPLYVELPQQPYLPATNTTATAAKYENNLSVIDVPQAVIDRIKKRFEGRIGQWCTTFDIVAALAWRCEMLANVEENKDIGLSFVTNLRPLIREMFPASHAYYGNCIMPVMAEIANSSSVVDIVMSLKEAKIRLPMQFTGLVGEESKKKLLTPLLRQRQQHGKFVIVTDVRATGLFDVDLGWGMPVYISPRMDDTPLPTYVVVKPPGPERGVRLVVSIVSSDRTAAFVELIMDSDM